MRCSSARWASLCSPTRRCSGWPASFCLMSVVLHIVAAVELTLMNWAARPQGYETKRSIATILRLPDHALERRDPGLFIVYHLLHLTVGVVGFQARSVPAPRGLQQRGGRLLRLVRVAVLHPGDGRPVPASGPRRLEHVPDARFEQRPDARRPSGCCREWWRSWCSPALSRCRSPCWPAGYAEGVRDARWQGPSGTD